MDVIGAVQYFFSSDVMPPGLNSNLVVFFFSKQEYTYTIDKFQHIMFGNFLFKIITEILANPLAKIAIQIVCPNRFSLIQGWQMHDCIVEAFECVHLLDKKFFDCNVVFPLNFATRFQLFSLWLEYLFFLMVVHMIILAALKVLDNVILYL